MANFRRAFRTMSNICDRAFYENNQRLKAVSYFCKKLYHRYFDSPVYFTFSETQASYASTSGGLLRIEPFYYGP